MYIIKDYDKIVNTKDVKTVIDLPEEVNEIIESLKANGHSAYAVGGCVRDSLMQKAPHDWDITTSALPEATKAIFSNRKLVLNGLKHGTVGVIINHRNFEVTSFRTEGNYSDNRHPDSVTFVQSIKDDLSRRDFTVNAIAYSSDEGIVDPFFGAEDIKNKTIRCVGDAGKRFEEDALRILRAIRFASVLNFKIEKNTAEMIHEKKHLLKNVSAERIRAEIEKTLMGENVFDVLQEFDDVFFFIIPELEKTKNVAQNCVYHVYDVWEHICRSVEKSKKDRIVRLTMLLHDIGKPLVKTTDENGVDHFKTHALIGSKIAEEILQRLKFDKNTVRSVTELVLHHDDRLYENIQNVPKYISRYGYDFLRKLDEVSRADIMAQNEMFLSRLKMCDDFINKLDECDKEDLCVTLAQLEVNGNDLKNIGLEGKEIGYALNKMLEKVLSGELNNNKIALLEFAKNLKD